MTNNKNIISQFQNLFTEAKNLENLQKYQEAINCYDEIIDLAQNTEAYKSYLIEAYLGKAFCLFKLEDFKKVIKYYNKIINFVGNEKAYKEVLIRAYFNIGFSYSQLEETENSKKAFENYFKEIVKTSNDEEKKIEKKRLFRFKEVNTNTLKELINNQLYTSFPKDDFNDPFDCNYEYLDKAEFHNQFKKVRISYSSMSDDKNPEPYKNKLMWSYYAKGHQGICIEYELQTGSFNQPNMGFFTVKYNNSRNFLPVSA
jgi:tetratricopeptide (TPR) repeat protein